MTATAQYTDLDSYKTLSKQLSKIVLNNGKPVEHTIRMPHDSQLVVIDALNTVIDAFLSRLCGGEGHKSTG